MLPFMAEPGLCGKCGTATECLNTSLGWMCRPCFHAALKTPQKDGPRLYTLPDPGKKVFVVMEPPNCFITVSNTLYAFDRKEEADELADGLKRGYGVHGAFVKEMPAVEVLQYVLAKPSLTLISVARKAEQKETLGPDEIRMPPL